MHNTDNGDKSAAKGNQRSTVREQCDIDKCYLNSQQNNSNPLERHSMIFPIHEVSLGINAVHTQLIN